MASPIVDHPQRVKRPSRRRPATAHPGRLPVMNTKMDKVVPAINNAKILDEGSDTYRVLVEASALAVPGKGVRIDNLSDDEILAQLGLTLD